jgi:hypothetical protein
VTKTATPSRGEIVCAEQDNELVPAGPSRWAVAKAFCGIVVMDVLRAVWSVVPLAVAVGEIYGLGYLVYLSFSNIDTYSGWIGFSLFILGLLLSVVTLFESGVNFAEVCDRDERMKVREDIPFLTEKIGFPVITIILWTMISFVYSTISQYIHQRIAEAKKQVELTEHTARNAE